MALMNPEFDTWQEAYEYCKTYDGFELMEPRTKSMLLYAQDQQRNLGKYLGTFKYSKIMSPM